MEKILFFILVLILVLTGCASNVPLTIPEKFDQVVVANFGYSMEDLDSSGEGKIDFLDILQAKEAYNEIKKTLEDTLNPPPFKVFMDSIYFTIVDSLKNGLRIPIQPLLQSENDIRHDFFDFPRDNVKSVAQKGKWDAAMAISVAVTFPAKQSTKGGNLFGVTKTEVISKPKLTLKVKMVDKSDKVIWRDRSEVRSKEWVVIDTKSLWGIRYKQEVTMPSVIKLTGQAVHQLVDKYRNY